MKLLLTSAGFLNKEVSDIFVKLLGKPAEQVKVIFIPTASRTEEELIYVKKSRQELINLGIKNIVTFNLDKKILKEDVKNADAIYVCGGNTFYLLKKIRESGLDRLLDNYNGLYVGVSAGSIVVGPSIEIAEPWDENDVNLSDKTGMKIVDFAVAVHYQRKDKTIIQKLKNRADYEIVELTDNQAVFIEDGERKIIGLP